MPLRREAVAWTGRTLTQTRNHRHAHRTTMLLRVLYHTVRVETSFRHLLSFRPHDFFNVSLAALTRPFVPEPSEVVGNEVPGPSVTGQISVQGTRKTAVRFAKSAYLFLHLGHWIITIPWWYARFENMCDLRSPHSGTLHVNVMEYFGSSGCSSLVEFEVLRGGCCLGGGVFVAESE